MVSPFKFYYELFVLILSKCMFKQVRRWRWTDICPTGYMNSFLAMWGVHAVCYLEFDYSPSPLSGWTLGNTSVAGQPCTNHLILSTCLRSGLSHRVPTGTISDNLASLTLYTVRLYRMLQNDHTIVPTFENPRPVWYLHPSMTPRLILVSMGEL